MGPAESNWWQCPQKNISLPDANFAQAAGVCDFCREHVPKISCSSLIPRKVVYEQADPFSPLTWPSEIPLITDLVLSFLNDRVNVKGTGVNIRPFSS